MAREKLVFGAQELRDILKNEAPREARNIIRATVYGVAGNVRDELKRRIAKRTRRAEKSIKAYSRGRDPNFPTVDVRGGATAPYLIMLEFGTSRTKAQPYITPTVEAMRPDLPRIYQEEFIEKLTKSIARRAKKAAMA